MFNFSRQFDLFHHFTEEDVKHYFLPIDNVIYSYVVETEEKKISDFVSFYCLPSTIINHPKHNQLRAAYSYYHVSTATPLNTLINNALILAKKNNFDVFNALNLMENESFLQVNRFWVFKL
jgi:glycylpeptide N-tetradecanoyltransferase